MAFRTKKISQMDPKGSNLASTDLLEISELVSGSYVTKSITGAEIIASVPPTTVEWGDIGGTLSAQTDLNTALSGKQATVTLTTTGTSGASTFVANTLNVPAYSLSGLGGVPTTRTLTINGTTQDLSADRTFTISTGITIGTTAITSGTVGRVLFEGTGNVVSESANLFWDNTNGRLGIGTSSPITAVEVKKTGSDSWITASRGTNSFHAGFLFNPSGSWTASNVLWNFGLYANTNNLRYWTYNGSTDTFVLNLFGSTANVGIGTTTDAGFKLDVNGTARVSNDLTIGSNRYLKAFRWTNDDVTRSLQIECNSNYNVDGLNIISWNNNLLNNTKNLVNIGLSSTVGTQSSGSTDFFNSVLIQTAYNFTFGTHTVKGIYYNPTLTSMVNTTHYAFHSTSGRHRYENLPTSPTGLASGDLWNNLGVLMIV